LIAIAGVPGSGKTVSAVGLAAQLVHMGATVFVADPHGEIEGGLLDTTRALSGGFERQAVRPDEIAAMAGLVAKIARRRLDGLDRADVPVVYLLDEFLSLLARGVLSDDVLTDLLSVALEARKARVHGILISQNWTSRAMPAHIGAMLRTAATHRIVHKADLTTAEVLLPSHEARQAALLSTGSAVFLGDDGMPGVIRVPNMATPQDMRYAARGKAPKPYAPRTLTVQSAPTAPALTAPPTLAQRIVALLADGTTRDYAAIVEALHADKPKSVQNELLDLVKSGRIDRTGTPRNYRYGRKS